MAKNVAVVLASGRGDRAGFARPKQMALIAGRPVIAHTLERFQSHPAIDEIAIVTNATCLAEIEALVEREGFGKVARVLPGGRERHDSSLIAIRAYEQDAAAGPLNLLLHDAVRPLVTHAIIDDVVAALGHHGAVDTAVGSVDTVVVIDAATNTIRDVPDRRLVRMSQTPQGFRYDVISTAFERAMRDPDFRTTDDCGVVIRYMPEEPVYVVEGAASNMKLTYADDLIVLERHLADETQARVAAMPLRRGARP